MVRPLALSAAEMAKFHDDRYVSFLENVTTANLKQLDRQACAFLGRAEHSDCPVFAGLFRYCQLYCGASVGAAARLNARQADVAVNWAGGFHHAKKREAAGFCYVNDIVLAVMELLRAHERVLYVDIDVHHGEGVEEAFYCTDRVLTASFHKGGDFFPGTGHLADVGHGRGRGYAVNVPLEAGVGDAAFAALFRPVVDAACARFRPGAVVLQCGADSLAGDRLGCFNLSTRGHGACVRHVLGLGLPTLLLGGGGYTVRNVARCWAHEAALAVGAELPGALPRHEFLGCYAPDYRLHVPPSLMPDLNGRAELEALLAQVLQNVGAIELAPSVAIGSEAEPEDGGAAALFEGGAGGVSTASAMFGVAGEGDEESEESWRSISRAAGGRVVESEKVDMDVVEEQWREEGEKDGAGWGSGSGRRQARVELRADMGFGLVEERARESRGEFFD